MRSYRSTPDEYLFNKRDWLATQEGWKAKLVFKIESMNGDELLNISTTDLARYFIDEYTLEVPVIHDNKLAVDQKETKIDVSQDRDCIILDRSQPFYITETTVDVKVPFSGNKVAFDIKPSTRDIITPRAKVRGGIIKFSITGVYLSPEEVKQEIDSIVESINKHLGWFAKDAKCYNAGLENLATQTIERRKEKLLKD